MNRSCGVMFLESSIEENERDIFGIHELLSASILLLRLDSGQFLDERRD